jgi:transcriptional regulator with XRE-family HTH domain
VTTTLKTMGGVVREARLSQGLTLGQVAYKVPTSKTYLSEIERGVKNPSFPMLESIAKALRLTLGDLLVMMAREIDTREVE